jgi:molybdopterin molybdotransferase
MNNRLVSPSTALEIILNSSYIVNSECIESLDALNRVLSDDVYSEINIPLNNNSAMDGYAVQHESLLKASDKNPVLLNIIGEIKAGDRPESFSISKEECVRIMTGGALPPGCDAVVPFEDTKETDGKVEVYRKIKINENIRFTGEDIAANGKVLSKSLKIKAPDIGLLVSINKKFISVYKKPSIAIISTGDEVRDIGEELSPGQIRNSNAYMLMNEIIRYGGDPFFFGIVKDDYDAVLKKIYEALEYNIVITIGGVSEGRYDFIRNAACELGINLLVEKVRMKPGRPFVYGIKGQTRFFGLPGNPVSAMLTFHRFVRPAILKIGGCKNTMKPVLEAVLCEDISVKPDRTYYLRGFFKIRDGKIYVSSTGSQGSGILSSLSMANCYIIIDEGIGFVSAGEKVLIELIEHSEVDEKG